jgi:hypothetical protein
VDAEAELLGIASVAVGLAGFAGIAAAFLLDRDYQRDDQLRFVALLFGTLSVVFLSFVPLLLVRAGMSEVSAWMWSSVVALLFSAGGLPIGLTIYREAHTFDKNPPRWVFLPLWAFFCSGPLAHGSNVAGLLRGPGPVLFLTGLLAWLAAGAILFAVIVLLRPQTPSQAAVGLANAEIGGPKAESQAGMPAD